MKKSRIGQAISIAALISMTGCSPGAGSAPAPAASTTAAPVYDTFEKIGDGISCLSLMNSEPETTDIKNNKYCNLEHPTTEGGGVTVYEYADLARRDKSLKAGLVYEQSFLVLSDNWAIAGGVKDLRKIKAILGTGDLRTAEPSGGDATEGGDGTGVGPGNEEEPLDLPEVETVPVGRSATYGNERVQAGKIYCNDLKDGKDPNKQYDSCRLSSYTDLYDDVIEAPKGREYFLVAFRWKNIGKTPVDPSGFGTLVTEDGVEYAAETDLSDTYTSSARGNEEFETSSEMNPGTSGRILVGYLVPKGTKVAKVHWGVEEYTDEAPAFALEVE